MSVKHIALPGAIPDTGETNKAGITYLNSDHVITDVIAAVGTIATDRPSLYGTQTWNAGGVTFTASKINVTDTASADGSKLLDLQVGAVTKFAVTKTGATLVGTSPTPAYDQAANTLGYGLAIGHPWSGAAVSINVPTGKVFFPLAIDVNNTGAGKMFGISVFMHASGATQDSESLRGIVVRCINDAAAGVVKTTAASFSAEASDPAFDGILWGVSGGVEPTAGTDAQSAVFVSGSNTVVDDKFSDYLTIPGGGARRVLGYGSHSGIAYLNAAFRAYMAAGSSASARAFQILDSAGAEIGWLAKTGDFVGRGVTLIANGVTNSQCVLNGNNNASFTGFVAPATAPNVIYTLPTTGGTVGQKLTTNGAGVLSWT